MDVFNFPLNGRTHLHAGNLLLAEPLLQDHNFVRSVILMFEHTDEGGSFGLVLNKRLGTMVQDLSNELPIPFPVYEGGPVEKNTLHFIHRLPDLEGAIALKNGLFWSGNLDDFISRYKKGEVTQESCRFFVGYSGWGKGQLLSEIKKNAWVIARINLTYLLDIQSDALWREVLFMMGGKYRILANYPVDPQLN